MLYQIQSPEITKLRRHLFAVDPVFALHHQVRQYFLTPSTEFGVMAADEQWSALAFFSTRPGRSYVHYYLGDLGKLEDFRSHWNVPCQLFLRGDLTPLEGQWQAVLRVTPGMVIDHPAYSGVFSRVVPRFEGTVFEHD